LRQYDNVLKYQSRNVLKRGHNNLSEGGIKSGAKGRYRNEYEGVKKVEGAAGGNREADKTEGSC
jgi:hypothetical protein